MSVPFQRISNATVQDIVTYDPAAERRAASLCVDWDTFFNIGSQEILYMMEWSWWPTYCQQTGLAWYFKNNAQGQVVSAFNPSLLIKSDQTLIRLDTFRAVMEFYQSLVTDVSNINEVDKTNFEFAKARYYAEVEKAMQLSNFYDLYDDGFVSKMEENYMADPDYFSDTRFF